MAVELPAWALVWPASQALAPSTVCCKGRFPRPGPPALKWREAQSKRCTLWCKYCGEPPVGRAGGWNSTVSTARDESVTRTSPISGIRFGSRIAPQPESSPLRFHSHPLAGCFQEQQRRVLSLRNTSLVARESHGLPTFVGRDITRDCRALRTASGDHHCSYSAPLTESTMHQSVRSRWIGSVCCSATSSASTPSAASNTVYP